MPFNPPVPLRCFSFEGQPLPETEEAVDNDKPELKATVKLLLQLTTGSVTKVRYRLMEDEVRDLYSSSEIDMLTD
jgi:hypothetical protein